MLTADQIAAMRGTMNGSLPGAAIIQTQSYVSDGGGGGTIAWTNAGTADCRIMAAKPGDEMVQGGRVHPDTQYILTLPADTDIDANAQVIYGDQTFAVINVHAPRTWEISRRVELKEVA